MTTSAYRLDPLMERRPANGRLAGGDRFLAGLAALLLALTFAFPLWGVRFTAPDQPAAVELTAYPSHLAGGASATVDELARVQELHRRVGLVPPRAGTYPWSWALVAGLGLATGYAVLAAASGRRLWLARALRVATGAAAIALALAVGQLDALGLQPDPLAAVHVTPFHPALVGTSHAGPLNASAGPRQGAFLLAAALGLAGVALWSSRPGLRRNHG